MENEVFGLSGLKIIIMKMDGQTGCLQRAGIAAGGIFYNVQPGTAAQLKI